MRKSSWRLDRLNSRCWNFVVQVSVFLRPLRFVIVHWYANYIRVHIRIYELQNRRRVSFIYDRREQVDIEVDRFAA